MTTNDFKDLTTTQLVTAVGDAFESHYPKELLAATITADDREGLRMTYAPGEGFVVTKDSDGSTKRLLEMPIEERHSWVMMLDFFQERLEEKKNYDTKQRGRLLGVLAVYE